MRSQVRVGYIPRDPAKRAERIIVDDLPKTSFDASPATNMPGGDTRAEQALYHQKHESTGVKALGAFGLQVYFEAKYEQGNNLDDAGCFDKCTLEMDPATSK